MIIDDIVPELLEKIKKEFSEKVEKNSNLATFQQLLENKNVTYKEANAFAIEIGEISATALEKYISEDILPDGRMYYNIGKRLLDDVLTRNYNLICDYTYDVQKLLNQQARINLKVQKPKINQDRIDGFVNRLDSEESFNDVKWLLDDPIVNFSQSIVDDFIELNAKFHAKAGLSPKLIRTTESKPCEWCSEIAGTYDYPAPSDIYKRHENCRCTVEYEPKNGRGIQNAHTKKWRNSIKNDRIEKRKPSIIRKPDIQLPKSVSAKARDIFVKYDIPVDGEMPIKGGSIIKKVNVIAGKGVRRGIDDINRLVRTNPGTKPSDWQKVTGIAEMINGEKAEIHWYQAKNVGKVEFKLKRWL